MGSEEQACWTQQNIQSPSFTPSVALVTWHQAENGGPHWSQGSWRSCVGPCVFAFALLDLAGTRTAVLDETACLSDVHPAVLTQRLAAV